MKKHLFLTVILLFLMILSACGSDSSDNEQISIGTGSTGGAYFPIGTGMAKIISEDNDYLKATASSTGGSVDNVELIESGDEDFGLVDMSVSYEFYNGDFPEIRALMMGYGNVFHLVVQDDSPIESYEDLKGKSVAIGPEGSGTANMSEKLFKSLGIWDDIDKQYLTHDQETQDLGDGRIDAAAYSIAVPGSSVEEFLSANNGRIVELEDNTVEKFLEDNPDHVAETIPAESYSGQEEDISTIAVNVALVTHEDTDEDMVYDITKTIMENSDNLEEYHPSATEFNFDNALDGLEIPLHEGAKKYYEEEEHPKLDEIEE